MRAQARLAIPFLFAAAFPTLSGCGGPEDVSLTDQEAATAIVGVDYSWSRPSIPGLKAAGYHFACRYLSYDTTGKNLSRHEADQLHANGLNVVVVWEQNANDALSGYGRGVSDARAAEEQARGDGEPNGRPIYFAVDFDASPGEQGAIDSYFDGVASVLGRHRTGVYAGYWPTKRLFDAGKVAYGWQTYAWSGGMWDPRAQLRQVLNGIGGGDLDRNIAVAQDYGQWWGAPSGGTAAPLRQRIDVAYHADGRLEVFSLNSGGGIGHDWEKMSGAWSGRYGLPGKAKQIAAATNADGRIEIFYVGSDDSIWHNWQVAADSPWYGEHPFGGSAKQIAVGKTRDGRLEVFYIGTNDELYHRWQMVGGGWSAEYPLGGKAKEIAVDENADGRIEVFYVGLDDAIWHNWQVAPEGPWFGEHRLGGKGKQIVTSKHPENGRLEVFYIGTNDVIYHNWESEGGWSGEHVLGGRAKQIAAAVNQDGRIEVFNIGMNDVLYHNYQEAPDSAWVGEQLLGGKAKQIAAARNPDGRLEIFYIGTDNHLYHNWQNHPNAGWAGQHAF